MLAIIKNKIILIIICIVAAASCIGIIAYNSNPSLRLNKQLKLGQKYLNEENWEAAIIPFTEAIKIDPKNVEAYLRLVEAYIRLENFEQAMEVTQAGYSETEDARLEELRKSIEETITNTARTENNVDNNTSENEKATEDVESELGENPTGNSTGNTEGNVAPSASAMELYTITEEEFQVGVVFNMMEVVTDIADDEYTRAVIQGVHEQMQSRGYTKGSVAGMLGRCHPIRFGEDVQTAVDSLCMDMSGILFNGGNHYDIFIVQKAANGYIFNLEVEQK